MNLLRRILKRFRKGTPIAGALCLGYSQGSIIISITRTDGQSVDIPLPTHAARDFATAVMRAADLADAGQPPTPPTIQ